MISELDEVGGSLNGIVITQQLVDDINSDLTRIKEIVIELQNLGFDGEITTARIGGQVVGTVTFYDKETSELFFETQIPDGTLGIFAVIGLKQEFSDKGTMISFDQLASLFDSSQGLVQAITNYEDDEIASNFVLASILAFHPSTGNTILPLIIILIYIAIIVCLNTPCADAVAQLIQQEAAKAFEFMYPLATVTGMKFEDNNGNGEKDDLLSEAGLPNWEFTLTTTLESEILFTPLKRTTNGTGHFVFFQANVPRFSDKIVIVETQKEGWESTTEGGELQELVFTPPSFDPTPNSPPGVTKIENVTFGNRMIAQQIIFEENFDSGIAGWSQSLCQLRNSGQECRIGTVTSPTPVPSPPNWGFSGIRDFVPGCAGSVATKHAKSFSVSETGNYEISAVMFGSTCSGCDVFARLFIDGQQILIKKGQRLGVDPPLPPSTQTAVVALPAGQHTIEIGMTSNAACFGGFSGLFDNIAITQTTASPTTILPGGPYYSLELNQTSVNATAPDSSIVRLKVHWDPGYESEPISVNVISNSTYTGISHTVTSAYNTTTYQAYDITFDISPEVQVGQYQYFIFVNEGESEDSLAEVVLLNVE